MKDLEQTQKDKIEAICAQYLKDTIELSMAENELRTTFLSDIEAALKGEFHKAKELTPEEWIKLYHSSYEPG